MVAHRTTHLGLNSERAPVVLENSQHKTLHKVDGSWLHSYQITWIISIGPELGIRISWPFHTDKLITTSVQWPVRQNPLNNNSREEAQL